MLPLLYDTPIQNVLEAFRSIACLSIDRVPKWAWLQVAVTSQARHRYSDDVTKGKKKMAVNGKFIQRRGCELAAERYDEPHLKSLQYDIHRY